MSQFYGSIQGNGKVAIKTGTKRSGMIGHIRGYNLGAEVEMKHVNGIDICRVYKTDGSNGYTRKLIAEFKEE